MSGRLAALLLPVAFGAGCSSYEPAPWEAADLLRELRSIHIEFPPDGLDSDLAATLALVHNPVLRALRREHEIAEHVVVAAGAWKNPEFRIGLQDLLSSGGNPWALALGLRIFPAVPGESDALISRARASERRVLAEIEDREARIVADTRIQHARMLLLEEQLQIVRAAQKVHDRVVAVVSRRVEAQASTRLDETLTVLKREELEDEHQILLGLLEVAGAELAAVMGAAPGAPVKVKKTAAPAAPDLAQDRLEEDALRDRADLRVLREDYDVREQNLRLAHLAQVFWPAFLEPGGKADRTGRSATLSAALEIPIFDSGGEDVAVEELRRRQARDAYVARLQAVRLEIHLAVLKLREMERQQRRHAERLEPLLRKSEELVRTLLEAGEADVLRLGVVETRVLEARRDAAQSRFEHDRARIQLALATGSIFRSP